MFSLLTVGDGTKSYGTGRKVPEPGRKVTGRDGAISSGTGRKVPEPGRKLREIVPGRGRDITFGPICHLYSPLEWSSSDIRSVKNVKRTLNFSMPVSTAPLNQCSQIVKLEILLEPPLDGVWLLHLQFKWVSIFRVNNT